MENSVFSKTIPRGNKSDSGRKFPCELNEPSLNLQSVKMTGNGAKNGQTVFSVLKKVRLVRKKNLIRKV